MRVAIDTTPLQRNDTYRGIGAYTRNLYNALLALGDGNEYCIHNELKHTTVDLVHYPFFDLYFLTLPWIKSKPTVVTIHDVIPLLYPDKYPSGLRGHLKLLIQMLSLKNVKAIVTDSMRSKQDIHTHLKVPLEKIFPIHLAANQGIKQQTEQSITKTLRQYGIKTPYLLYVGDVNFNKNVTGLIRAFAKTQISHELVLVSRAFTENISEVREIDQLIGNLNLQDRIKRLPDIPSEPAEILAAIYSGADWYIQPSLYEGFGLPVLEAIECRVPVMMTDGGSLKEIMPPGAVTLDATDIDQMAYQIDRAVSLPFLQKQRICVQNYQFGRQFSWKITAEKTRSVYRHTLHEV